MHGPSLASRQRRDSGMGVRAAHGHISVDPAFFLSQVHGYRGVTFQNWAKTYGCCPEMYYQPTSVGEIREVSVLMAQPLDLQLIWALETRPCPREEAGRWPSRDPPPPPQHCWPGKAGAWPCVRLLQPLSAAVPTDGGG